MASICLIHLVDLAEQDNHQAAPSENLEPIFQSETGSGDELEDRSDSEESDSDGEETAPRVENPSTDIRGDLEKIISSATKSFKGSFYFEKRCDAPNPTLRLISGNIGTVGLPLVELAAKQIIACSEQVPSAKEAWEMDGGLVAFDNPAWNSFIVDVAAQVYKGLGINFHASKPKIELYKLLLHGTGSHFLPHQYTEKAEGMFATMVVTLPSAFTGGAIHLSHAGLPAVIDSSADSLISTSVAAWYTGVTHEFKPVTSGYRLALSYNLIHTTDAPRPSLPVIHELPQLRHILLSWKQSGYSGPQKIVCLLQKLHDSAAALRDAEGADAHLVSFLGTVARELDFKLGMAKCQLTISGAACGPDDYGRDDYYDSDENEDDDVDSDDLEFADNPDYDMTITDLVDLEGCSVCDEVLMDKEDEKGQTIPANISGALEAGPCDEQEYDRHCGGDLTRHYARSVLVIWPSLRDEEIAYGDGYFDYVLESLRTTTSTKADREERQFVERVLASHHPEAGPDEGLQSVCTAACQWRKLELWRRAMDARGGYDSLDKLGLDYLMDAVAEFGYNDMLPSIEKMLQKDKSNTRRFKLLEQIESDAKAKDDSSVGHWISEKRESVLGSLRPFVAGEDKLLIELVKAPGGIAVLEHKIVPQAESNSKPRNLLSLVLALHAEKIRPDSCFKSADDKEIGSRAGARLLSRAIKRKNFFELVDSPAGAPSYHPYWTPRRAPSTKLAEQYLDACLKTENEALIVEVVKKLMAVPRTTRNAGPTAAERDSILIALVPYFSKMVEERSDSLPPLPPVAIDLFYKTTMPFLLAQMQKADLKEDDVTSVSATAHIRSYKRSILPKFKAVGRGPDTYKLFIRQLRAREAQFALKPSPTSSIPAIVTDLLTTMIGQLDLTVMKSVAATIDMLEFCYEANNGPRYADVLSKLVKDGNRRADCVESFLLPLIPDLVGFASRHGISVTAPPLVSYFQTVLGSWIKGFFGSRSPVKSPLFACAQKIKCKCNFCSDVVKFLSSTEQSLQLFGIGAPKTKHLENALKSAGVGAVATWNIVMTSPRGFKITKTNEAHQASRWEANKRKGILTLKSISTDENVLASVFEGSKYDNLLRYLDVPWVNAPVRAEPSSVISIAQPSVSTSAVTAAYVCLPATRAAPGGGDTSPSKRQKVDRANVEIIDLT
ncbi:hypothetical protein BOTBODRAFT_174150 [Botryobasidium botryosum FD-172 SS1]|uniref:Prolyl 4-hydroxylase alpha subunit Fe(2+) 2OG dioxygenase domain-containing protein n=1 Tax=Botryobasidium botryosum (strain FD-172 SS1) TaxID=930990 RepID=A0A067MIG7_BOTB1|nr:hypothetical protein BOTBODRAFT_174150 [Botryobasidium botryosum FD-172 SS1]